MPLDQPALIGPHLGQGLRVEAPELFDLTGEGGRSAGHAIREDDLDTLPAVTRDDLEDRPDFDDEARFLQDLPREGILDPLARMQKAAEESPLRRAEAVPREQDLALLVHSESCDADEEAIVRGRHETSLPSDGERVEDRRQKTHEHRRKDYGAAIPTDAIPCALVTGSF